MIINGDKKKKKVPFRSKCDNGWMSRSNVVTLEHLIYDNVHDFLFPINHFLRQI